MASQVLLSTVGPSDVTIDDFGARTFTHPTVDFDLLTEFSLDEIRASDDLQSAVTGGTVTLEDQNSNSITDVGEVGAHQHYADDVQDFDTEVGNNTDVTANTSARHDQQHALGSGTDHTSATLAQLNSLVSDATLDDSSSTRDPNSHNLAGSAHNADTLANLNSKVSDATLDDSSSPRTPTSHASSHQNGGGDEISVAGLSGTLADPQTPSSHALGGSAHSADTLANLNLKVSDATLDDSGDPRTPTAHATSHESGGSDEVAHQDLSGTGTNTHAQVDSHISSTSNPHSVTAAQAGAAPTTHASQHQHGGADEVATATPAANAIPKADGSGKLNAWVDATGSGDVVGPASATDEALARYDGTTGKLIQNSGATLTDAGVLTVPGAITSTGGGVTANTGAGSFGSVSAGTGGISTTGSITVSGTVDGRDVALDGTNQDNHIASTSNPHSTDIGNLGSGTLAELNSAVSDATLDDSNDSRTPTAHASTHQSGGSDPIKLDDLAATDDNTDLNATVSSHGLLPKLGGGTTDFLRADGTWQPPPGGDDADAIHDDESGEINAIAQKSYPIGTDILIAEDSASTFSKKKIEIQDLNHTWYWQNPVIDKDISYAPGSPSTGDRYIVAGGGDGDDWIGHGGEIAEWTGSAWIFVSPMEGFITYVLDENLLYYWTGSAWQAYGTTDDDAIHDNVAGEINAITNVTTPIDDDIVLIERSNVSWGKGKVALSNLPSNSAAEGHTWTFSTITTDADPGTSIFRLNNATQSSATYIYVDDFSRSGVNFSSVLIGLQVGDRLYLQETADRTRYLLCQIDGDVEDATGYVKIPISVISSSGTLRNNKLVTFDVFETAIPKTYDAIVAPSGGDYTSIKAAFDAGANTVFVRTGFYVETSTITMPSGAALIGEGGAVINLVGTARIEVDGSGGTQETTGTISVPTDSTTVTGVGTTFTNLSAGDWINIGPSWVQIDSITNDTSLELEYAYRGEAVSGDTYKAQGMAAGAIFTLINVLGGSNGCLYLRACVGISIRDCVFQGATGGGGVTIVDSYGGHIEQTFAKANVGAGLTITDSAEIAIEGSCHFDNNDGDGFLMNGNCYHILAANSSATNNGGDGVSIEGTSEEITLSNVICDLNDGKGVNTEPTTGAASVISCILEHNGDWGIDFDGSENVINGCVINENGTGGVQGGDSGNIVGCQICENTGPGLNMLAGDDGNIIASNRICDNTDDGIILQADNCIISDNFIDGNGAWGIDISAGGQNNNLSNNIVTNNTSGSINDLGSGNIVQDEAIHPDISSQISGITSKGTPTNSDYLIIEDAADSNNKKSITIGSLPSGGGSGQTIYDAIVAPSGGDYTSVKSAVDAGHQAIFVRSGNYSEAATISLPSTGIVIDGEENSIISLSGGAIIQLDASGGTQQTTGTVSVVNDATTVTGSGTTFTNLSSGDYIRLGDDFLEIDSITNNTALELVEPWDGDNISGQSLLGQSMASGLIMRRLQITGGRLFLRACRDAVIEDVSISGSTSTFGLGIHDCFRTRLERVRSEYHGTYGLEIDASLSTKMHSSVFSSNETTGIWVSGGTQDMLLSGSECKNNDGYGLYIEDTGTSDIKIIDSVLSFNNVLGVFTDSLSTRVEVTNCTIRGNGVGGINLQCPDGIVKGNVVLENLAQGIEVDDNSICSDNYCCDNTTYGIEAEGNYCTFSGNFICDNGSGGIYVSGDYNTFTGNVIRSNTGNGFNIAAAGGNNTFSNNHSSGNSLDDYDDNGTGNINYDFVGKTISAYDSVGGQSYTTTATTVNLDSTHFTPDSNFYSLASDEITVLKPGKYLIDGQVSLENSTTSRSQAMAWLENNTVEVGGTRVEQYLRQTNHGATGGFTVCLDLSANDVLRLRSVRTQGSGTCRTEIDGSRLRITKVE